MSVNLLCGQTSNFEWIFNEWNEGEINAIGNVIDGGTRRGGWDHLTINRDSTVIYSDAFTCGTGSKRTGTWKLDKRNSLIIFSFNNIEGYMNNPKNGAVNIIKTYRIEKLTQSELILIHQDSNPPRRLAFLRIK